MTCCLSINTYNKRFGQISFLPLELDPLTYTKDLQRAKFRKSITGHNFWLVCPTDLRSTSLSCIFNALFRDTSLAYLLSRYVCHICHVTCVTCVTYVTCQVSRKVGKWGIPEKSIKNAAQRRWSQVRRTLQSKVIARKRFLDIPPPISPPKLETACQVSFMGL